MPGAEELVRRLPSHVRQLESPRAADLRKNRSQRPLGCQLLYTGVVVQNKRGCRGRTVLVTYGLL